MEIIKIRKQPFYETRLWITISLFVALTVFMSLKTHIWFSSTVDRQYDYQTQQRSRGAEIKVAMIKTAEHRNFTFSLHDSINEAEGKHRTAASTQQPFCFSTYCHAVLSMVSWCDTVHTQCRGIVSLNANERAVWHIFDWLKSKITFWFLITLVIFSLLKGCMEIMTEGEGVQKIKKWIICIFSLW